MGSSARCRELVALHLPRGTGPKTRDDVKTFSVLDVQACRKEYTDQVHEPARHIQKAVYELRDQRRVLQLSRQKLWTVTEGPLLRQRAEEERKNTVQGLAIGGLLGSVKDKDKDADSMAPSLDTTAKEANADRMAPSLDTTT